MKTPEGFEKAALDKYLAPFEKRGECWVCKPATYGMGVSGNPDRIVILRGRVYGLEVKREGKGPTVLQDKRMAEIRAAGGYAFAGTAAVLIAEIEKTLAPVLFA